MKILISQKSSSYTISFPAGTMDAIVQQIFLFLFFINFPKTMLSKNSCPFSSCGAGTINYLPIYYPFKLQTNPLPKHCQDYINLRCNNQGQAIINLPSSGDFYVTYIDYFEQNIGLSDPENCLLRRLMTNFSLSPLEAFRYENYTYYTCPRNDDVMYRFSEIKCLSNSTNVTIATAITFSSEFMEEMYGCRAIVSSMIPVSLTSEYNSWGFFGDLQLTWNVSGCKDCEDNDAESSGDSRSGWRKLLGSPLFIPSTIVLVTFFGVACFLRFTKLMVTGADTNNTTENNPPPDSATTGTSTTAAPSQTTRDMPSAPPGTTNGTVGIDASKLNNCTELVVLGESQGTSLPISLTCSICLEEYHVEDTVRYLPHCDHYFHVECIDQWLQKNNTCPVCRTTLFEL